MTPKRPERQGWRTLTPDQNNKLHSQNTTSPPLHSPLPNKPSPSEIWAALEEAEEESGEECNAMLVGLPGNPERHALTCPPRSAARQLPFFGPALSRLRSEIQAGGGRHVLVLCPLPHPRLLWGMISLPGPTITVAG